MQYSIVTIQGQESLTAFVNGELLVATDSHPNYQQIKAGVLADDRSVVGLFDIRKVVNSAFGEVTDRVTVLKDEVTLDGKTVHGSISRVLMDLVGQGERDGFIGLARFLERLSDNPSHRSREQLYDFVEANGITIDKEGMLVLYKGVQPDGKGGWESIRSGEAYVNGELVKGHIPARVGDVVSMDRKDISDDPNVACHQGLHAGASKYANNFARGATLRVFVDPMDVVSVPADSSKQKMRVSAYTIGDIVEKEMPAYWSGSDYEDETDYEDYDDEDYDVEEEASVWPPRPTGGATVWSSSPWNPSNW